MLGISCICLTYGRSWLLAEAIEAYLRQDFNGPSELVIINDFEGITLSVDDSRCNYKQSIEVFNMSNRFKNLNDKFDYGVKQSRYCVTCMWDDDDICLPHRLQSSWDAIECQPIASYMSFSHHYNMDGYRKPSLVARGIHGGDVFDKELYQRLDGSQGEGHNDQNFVAKAKADGSFYVVENPINPFYIYRWGGITGHQSCYGGDVKSSMQRFHQDVVRDRRFIDGEILVVPAWTVNYEELVK